MKLKKMGYVIECEFIQILTVSYYTEEGRRHWQSLIILITLTLCPEHFSVSIPVAEPEDLYRFWAMQKYLIFGMINEIEHDQVSCHSFEPLSFA